MSGCGWTWLSILPSGSFYFYLFLGLCVQELMPGTWVFVPGFYPWMYRPLNMRKIYGGLPSWNNQSVCVCLSSPYQTPPFSSSSFKNPLTIAGLNLLLYCVSHSHWKLAFITGLEMELPDPSWWVHRTAQNSDVNVFCKMAPRWAFPCRFPAPHKGHSCDDGGEQKCFGTETYHYTCKYTSLFWFLVSF